jgi:hypothetical protein
MGWVSDKVWGAIPTPAMIAKEALLGQVFEPEVASFYVSSSISTTIYFIEGGKNV